MDAKVANTQRPRIMGAPFETARYAFLASAQLFATLCCNLYESILSILTHSCQARRRQFYASGSAGSLIVGDGENGDKSNGQCSSGKDPESSESNLDGRHERRV